MLTYRDLVKAFRDLDLGPHSRVIVHASLRALGPVTGGAETVVGALLATCEAVLAPTFTYKTMITPPIGPPDNAMDYGTDGDRNLRAEFFHADMPSDPALGALSETLRLHPQARRSGHPILSFAGVNAEQALELQTLDEPLAPLHWLADADGDVLLLGVDHTANTSIHLAEHAAGRKQFVRWALTPQGVVECPGFPGCSRGFQAIASRLEGVARRVELGQARAEMVPLRDLINITVGWIREDPRALLCDHVGCPFCSAVRAAVRVPPE